MGKLNRAALFPVVFCLSISLLFSGCKTTPIEVSLSSGDTSNTENTSESENTSSSSSVTDQTDGSSTSNETKEYELPYDLSVQIIGTVKDGDSTIIKYKNIEILIDTTEGEATLDEVKKAMANAEDNIWEYVIFTHPDQDHIGRATKLFDLFDDSSWEVQKVIDFGTEREEDQESPKETETLKNYKKRINELKEKGKIEYYTPNGNLSSDSGNLVEEIVIDPLFKISILYNAVCNSRDDNNHSVCCLFTFGEQKLLFTGDLGKDGEIALIENHPQLLRNVTFFKAGHHGSKTSNSKQFIDWIRPAYVAITFNNEITMDSLAICIDSFLKYTDYIYPTVVKSYETPEILYGNCVFSFNGKLVKVTSDVNNESTIRNAVINELNNLNWFEQLVKDFNIVDEINTYFFDENTYTKEDSLNDKDNGLVVNDRPGNLAYYNCTLVKYGHFDILIDCGSINTESQVLVDKLKDYVVDGVIEYVIVSHYHLMNYSQLIGSQTYEGVFNRFKVETVIDNDNAMTNSESISGTAYSIYLNKVRAAEERISLNNDEVKTVKISNGLDLSVYRGNNSQQQNNEDDYSLVTVIDFNGRKMVFVGDLTNYTWFNKSYARSLGEIYLLRFPSSYVEFNKMSDFGAFLNISKPKVIVIGSPVNHWNNGQFFIKGTSVKGLVTFLENSSGKRNIEIYTSGYVENNRSKTVFGDMDFTLFKGKKVLDKEYEYYVSCRLNLGYGRETNNETQNSLHTSYFRFVPDTIKAFPAIK